MFDCAVCTLVRYLYTLLLYALQNPLVLFGTCLAIGYVQVAEVDVRQELQLLYERVAARYMSKRWRNKFAYNMSHGPHTWKCEPICQSPINIDDSSVQKLIIRELLNWNHYDDLPNSVTLENTGCALTLRADYRGNRPTLSGADLLACYTFVEMRFHWGWSNSDGSEHTLNNKKFPLELQVMHRTGPSDGACTSSYDLLMIAYFFELSTHNPYLDPITQNLKLVQKSGKKAVISPFPLAYLVYPFRTGFYSYGGSLTEPPCYQGTEWFIFPEAIAINEFQLRQFRQLLSSDDKSPITRNSRPVQSLGSRVVSLNQFCPFDNCQMLDMADVDDDCIEETTINTTTIITTTNISAVCSNDCNNNNNNSNKNDNNNKIDNNNIDNSNNIKINNCDNIGNVGKSCSPQHEITNNDPEAED